MKHFLQNYADSFALFFSLATALVLAISIWLKSKERTRVLALPFFFFGPVLLLVCMALHLLENLFHTLERYQGGSFVYDFRLYALLFFGIVLGLQARLLLLHCLRHATAPSANWKGLLYSSGRIVLISLPTFPLTPIGLVPTITCSLMLAAALAIRKRKKAVLVYESMQPGTVLPA